MPILLPISHVLVTQNISWNCSIIVCSKFTWSLVMRNGVKLQTASFSESSKYSVDSIIRTVHLAFHGLFSLLEILFTNNKQYF